MKRWIHASSDMYKSIIESRRKGHQNEYITLGSAAMTGVEVLDIFEDDDATKEELADALVEYMDKYYVLNDKQRQYVRNMVSKAD